MVPTTRVAGRSIESSFRSAGRSERSGATSMIWQSSASRSIVKRLPEIFTSGAFRFLNQSIWSPSFLWDLRIDQPAKKDDGMILAAPTECRASDSQDEAVYDKRATARSLRTRVF